MAWHDSLSNWQRFRPSLCEGCQALCCTLPVEVTKEDLLRMEVATADEAQGSLKKLGRRLEKEGIIRSFRAASGLFTLQQKLNGDCLYLGTDRRCTIYDKRPAVCRDFPKVGPKPGHCPAKPITDSSR